MEAIRHSNISRVYLVGRRGPLQVAFTVKELREMVKLSDCRPLLNAADFEGIPERIGGKSMDSEKCEVRLIGLKRCRFCEAISASSAVRIKSRSTRFSRTNRPD